MKSSKTIDTIKVWQYVNALERDGECVMPNYYIDTVNYYWEQRHETSYVSGGAGITSNREVAKVVAYPAAWLV